MYAPLCYYAAQITHDQDAAEDIVEDSFIKIWDRRTIFIEKNVLRSYLYTTVKNASINWIKKYNKISSLPENLALSGFCNETYAFKYILGSEIYSKLSSAIEQLSPQGKQIISMIFFEGKDTRTVAEQLGVSQSTVKTQKGRSLLKLKKSLG